MPRLGRGALTFRGTLAGRGRLDVQGGEPTFWKLPGPPQLLVHPALTRPRHAAFPEPRANVSLLQPRLPSPLIPWKAGWRDEGLRGGSPAGKGARAGKEAGSWLWLPIQGEAWASGPPGLWAPRPRGILPHPRLGPSAAFLPCTRPVLPQAAACSLELFTSLTSYFRSSEPLSGSSWTPPGSLAFEAPALKPLRPSAPGAGGGWLVPSLGCVSDG